MYIPKPSPDSNRQLLSTTFSPNEAVDATVRWLLDLGLPPLPIAPYFDPARGESFQQPRKSQIGASRPKFTGKNPSFLTRWGKPILIRHRPYQSQLPDSSTLKDWFIHPNTGVATMSGWRNIIWVDIDAKHFRSTEECRKVTAAWIHLYGLSQTWIERTQSGGYHIALQLPCSAVEFSIFRFDDAVLTAAGVDPSTSNGRVGEIIRPGLPVVLAPTVGVAGDYRCLRRAVPLAGVGLEQIGIMPMRAPKQQAGSASDNGLKLHC